MTKNRIQRVIYFGLLLLLLSCKKEADENKNYIQNKDEKPMTEFVEKSGVEWDEYLYVKKFDDMLPSPDPTLSYLNLYCLQEAETYVVCISFEKNTLRVTKYSFDDKVNVLAGTSRFEAERNLPFVTDFSEQVDKLKVSISPSIYTMTTHGGIYIIKASLERYNLFAVRSLTSTIQNTNQSKTVIAIVNLLKTLEANLIK